MAQSGSNEQAPHPLWVAIVSHLSDPAEREWLTTVSPSDVVKNAHRIYEFMGEGGLPADSYTRELAFQKAETALGVPYDVLYNAWLDEQPVATEEG
jgi:hypothetical protein